MNFATLALMMPLAMTNPPQWKIAPTPACNSGCYGAAPQQLPGFPAFPQPCPPSAEPAPLLMSKVIVPAGVTITAQPGSPTAKAYANSTVFGFRPGYHYRLALSNLPNHPNANLFPLIEVYGSLVPRKGLNYWEFPAPITFSESDIAKALSGGLVTKIIYLEDPKKAVPIAATADRPHEFNEDTIERAKLGAVESGRVVAKVTLGDRVPTATEISNVNNTILFPGENYLAAPSAMPSLGWVGVQLFDPVIGPKPPVEECLTDGGDKETRLGFDKNGKLAGLDATDVAVEYSQNGKRKVATSNEVCICSPRFAIRKAVLQPNGLKNNEQLGVHSQATVRLGFQSNTHTLGANQKVKANVNEFAIRPMTSLNNVGLHSLTHMQRAVAVFVVQGTHSIVSSEGPDEKNSTPDRLVVTKSVEPKNAVQIGEMVTFTIRYENRTKTPINDLVITDSLSGRLEFVQGSAASDRTSNVATTPNDAGSVGVRFEIPGQIAPGETGTVSFKARVR